MEDYAVRKDDREASQVVNDVSVSCCHTLESEARRSKAMFVTDIPGLVVQRSWRCRFELHHAEFHQCLRLPFLRVRSNRGCFPNRTVGQPFQPDCVDVVHSYWRCCLHQRANPRHARSSWGWPTRKEISSACDWRLLRQMVYCHCHGSLVHRVSYLLAAGSNDLRHVNHHRCYHHLPYFHQTIRSR